MHGPTATTASKNPMKHRVADVLARRLALHTRLAFGVPGGEILTFLDALDRAGVRFVLTRHEASAGFAARAAQRVDGGVGLLVATLGPGVANTVLPALDAQQARRPLVVVTGCVQGDAEGTYTHQIVDHRRLLEPVVKASFRVTADHADTLVRRAIALARDGVPGPVHLDLPTDVAERLVDVPTRLVDALDRRDPSLRASRIDTAILASPAPFDRLRGQLRSARRPLLILGLEALDADVALLRRTVARAGVPVLTTYDAKGLVDEHEPHALGAFGLSPSADRSLLPWIRDADFVVLCGYDPVEVRASWRMPFGEGATVVELTRAEALHGMHVATHTLVGDPARLLESLFAEVPPSRPWVDDSQPLRAALVDTFAPTVPRSPCAIAKVLEEEVPSDAWWTLDTGAHRIVLSQALRLRAPRLIQSSGLSTMACAIPFAIGAALASPGAPLVAIVGDGGLEMAMGELCTLAERALPVVVVVLDDRSLALIELKQRQRGLTNLGVDFVDSAPDHAAVARACGLDAFTADDEDALRVALRIAFASRRPSLVHVRLPRRAYDEVL